MGAEMITKRAITGETNQSISIWSSTTQRDSTVEGSLRHRDASLYLFQNEYLVDLRLIKSHLFIVSRNDVWRPIKRWESNRGRIGHPIFILINIRKGGPCMVRLGDIVEQGTHLKQRDNRCIIIHVLFSPLAVEPSHLKGKRGDGWWWTCARLHDRDGWIGSTPLYFSDNNQWWVTRFLGFDFY